ncbi:MAG TPA: hypothetical protein VG032_05565 [Acidimicrobiales bacterium]|nr:hypothetical protein [Acidimicrobiales bacterium]
MFVGGGLVTFARAPSVIVHPQLWAEDGAVFFQSAYNQGWHGPLLEAQAGYLQTFSRLIADVGLLTPLAWVPALFAGAALAVQVLPAVLVASRRFARAVPDRRVRLLLAAAYLAVPNSSEVNVDLTNAQWHLAVLAVLVVLALPATGAWRVFDIGVIVCSGLTGPFVLSLVVIAALVYHRRRQAWTVVLGAISVAAASVQIFEILTSRRPPVGPLGATAPRLVEMLGGRLIGTTLLGTSTSTSTWFTGHLLASSTILVIGAVLVVIFAVWSGPFELKMFNLWAALVLAGSLVSPLASSHGLQWPNLIGDPGGRYWLFPSLALLADLIWVAGQYRSRRIVAVGALLVLLSVAVFGVREDFRYPTITAPSWPAQVHRFDRAAAGSSFVFEIRPPGWTMTLHQKH